jgi:hypothetical protein
VKRTEHTELSARPQERARADLLEEQSRGAVPWTELADVESQRADAEARVAALQAQLTEVQAAAVRSEEAHAAAAERSRRAAEESAAAAAHAHRMQMAEADMELQRTNEELTQRMQVHAGHLERFIAHTLLGA